MIHARPDYNRIQDPALLDPSLKLPRHTAIGEDEPVILFRAKDLFFVDVLEGYRHIIMTDCKMNDFARNAMVASIDEHIERARAWRREHRDQVKPPDL